MRTIDTKMTVADMVNGERIVCVAVDDNHHNFKIGDMYMFRFGGSTCYVHDNDGIEITRWTWTPEQGAACDWDNGKSWVEFIPASRLTEEDFFTMKLGGPEAIFGPRTTKLIGDYY